MEKQAMAGESIGPPRRSFPDSGGQQGPKPFQNEPRSNSDSEDSYVSTDREDEADRKTATPKFNPAGARRRSDHVEAAKTDNRTYGDAESAMRPIEANTARRASDQSRLEQPGREAPGEEAAGHDGACFRYLQSLGPMNPLVRASLIQQQQLNGELGVASVLRPALADSGLRFTDLSLNANTQEIDELVSPSFNLFLIRALHVPLTGVARPVLRRTARVCLLQGTRLVGNSIAMQARAPKRDVEPWIFTPKATGNQCLVRSNLDPVTLTVYIELNVCYDASAEEATGALNRAKSDSCHLDEVTCAHATFQFPKTPNVGKQMAEDREFIVPLMGGSLWDPVDLKELAKNEGRSASLWTRLAAKPPNPTLRLRVVRLSQAELQESKSLPGTVLATPPQLPFFALYRQLCARRLLARADAVGAPLFAPALALFPQIADDPALFEALLAVWQKRANYAVRDKQFQRCLLQVWALMQTRDLPPRGFPSDSLGQEARASYIRKYLQHSVGENLGSSKGQWKHRPFDSKELVFDWQRQEARV